MHSTLLRRSSSILLLGVGFTLLLRAGTRRDLQPPAGIGLTDVNVITGAEAHPNITQNNSVVWAHGDTIVVA